MFYLQGSTIDEVCPIPEGVSIEVSGIFISLQNLLRKIAVIQSMYPSPESATWGASPSIEATIAEMNRREKRKFFLRDTCLDIVEKAKEMKKVGDEKIVAKMIIDLGEIAEHEREVLSG